MSYKSNAIIKERQRAQERSEDRSGFTQRNYWLYVLIAFLVLPLATLLSICTEGFNYYVTWAAPMGYLRIIPVAMLAICVNVLLIMTGKGTVDDIQDGVFSSKLYDKALFVIKFFVFAGCLYWSVTQSLAGAPHLRTYLKEQREPVENLLADPNDINEQYAERRAQQLSLIRSAQRTTWKGNMTRDAIKAMRAAQAELAKVDALIAAERATLSEGNASIEAKYNEELTRNEEASVTIAGIGQLFQIVCVLIIGLWYSGVEDEAGIVGAAAGAGVGSGAGGGRSIGFRSGAAAAAHHPTSHGDSPDPTAGIEDRRRAGFKHYDEAVAGASPALPTAIAPAAAPTVPSATTTDGAIATHRDNNYEQSLSALGNDILLGYWKRKNSNLQSYANPNRTPSNATRAAILRLRGEMEPIEKELATRGLKIELQEIPRKRYALVPL